MELWSSDFEHKGQIPVGCTCDGEDRPPQLQWSGVPEQAAELAVTCEDVDAPGGTFVHWVLWGLDPTGKRLTVDASAGALTGENDFEGTGYGGPCPPPRHGYHHYHFRLYAISERLQLPAGSSINDLRRAMTDKVLDTAELIGVYSR